MSKRPTDLASDRNIDSYFKLQSSRHVVRDRRNSNCDLCERKFLTLATGRRLTRSPQIRHGESTDNLVRLWPLGDLDVAI